MGRVFKDCLYDGAFASPQMNPHQGACLLGLVRHQIFHNLEMLFRLFRDSLEVIFGNKLLPGCVSNHSDHRMNSFQFSHKKLIAAMNGASCLL
jgi:hypothetical protein